MGAGAVLVCFAYLAGSFPSGVVLSRLFLGQDVRKIGSGNIGAANAARAGGVKLGVAVGLLDALKGIVPVLIGRWVGLDATALALVALAAVLGHDFSVFLGFRGGKGVATTLGVALALSPLAGILALVCWGANFFMWRISSLASLAAMAALPVLVLLTHQPISFVLVAAALFVLAAVKHSANISRLIAGTERSFGRRTADGD